mmetsp:Transcript_68953/g.199672  ORF Transcript_68953/g.199672 Transcript_68953/m.199672 type:complete len:246 (+) Transcript_68953:264-1001(+)
MLRLPVGAPRHHRPLGLGLGERRAARRHGRLVAVHALLAGAGYRRLAHLEPGLGVRADQRAGRAQGAWRGSAVLCVAPVCSDGPVVHRPRHRALAVGFVESDRREQRVRRHFGNIEFGALQGDGAANGARHPPGGPRKGHRPAQRAAVWVQQWRLPLRLRRHAGGLRASAGAAFRNDRLLGGAPQHPAVPHGRPVDRMRHPVLHHACPLRPRLCQRVPVQLEAHQGPPPAPTSVPARALLDQGLP